MDMDRESQKHYEPNKKHRGNTTEEEEEEDEEVETYALSNDSQHQIRTQDDVFSYCHSWNMVLDLPEGLNVKLAQHHMALAQQIPPFGRTSLLTRGSVSACSHMQ